MRKTYWVIAALITVLCAFGCSAMAATYYLDASVSSSGSGQSWATAWKNFSNITGLNPGDVVYISGGTSGLSYTVSSAVAGPNGTQANRITYKAATDVGHTGLVTLNCSGQCVAANGAVGNWTTWDGTVGGANNIVFNSSGSDAVFGQNSSGSVLRHININGGDLNYWGADNVEIDHVVWNPTVATVNSIGAGDGDAVLCPNGGAASYTTNLIHDSTFTLWFSGPGVGLDGLKWCANITVYNNKFIGVQNSAYTGGQHQDGSQSYADFEDYHDNYYENMQNYSLYCDPHDLGSTTCHHWRIYNNVMNLFNTSGGSYGVAIGCENVVCNMSDVLVANNTVVNAPHCMGLNTSSLTGTVTPPFNVVNNICYNSQAIEGGGSGVTYSNNTNGSTTGLSFVNAASNATGDWHLTSTATAAISLGISPSYLTSVYTTDKDGNSRPSGVWDIGAYEYGGSASLSPPSGLTATVQ